MYAQMSGRIYAHMKADSRGTILVMLSVVTFKNIAEAAFGVCDTEEWVPGTEGGF